MKLSINQIHALGDFLDALEKACVDIGVTPNGDMPFVVSDGHGGNERVIISPEWNPTGDEWSLVVEAPA